MDNNFIPKGLEIIKQAKEADEAEDYETARKLYKTGLRHLKAGMKYTKTAAAKEAIREKIEEYLARAEYLKDAVPSGTNGKKAVVEGSGGKEKGGKDEDPETAKLKNALAGAIVTETPNVKWSDVAGLEAAKETLKEAVIMPIRFPGLFVGKREPWRGILLYGPPGTGKSFLAKAVATEAGGSCFLSVSSSDLVSKFQGESERLVRNLFEMARERAPAIIFIDEIDSLCSARGDGENEAGRRIKTEFLVQMQGVGKGNDGILVLGATNTPWELDPAIRRRFEKRVYIPLPEAPARATMFKLHIGDTPNNLTEADFTRLGTMCEGFSGSDVSVCVRDALYEPVRLCQFSTHFRQVPDPAGKQEYLWEPCAPRQPGAKEMNLLDGTIKSEQLRPLDVSFKHVSAAVGKTKASVGPDDLLRLEEWTVQFGQEGSDSGGKTATPGGQMPGFVQALQNKEQKCWVQFGEVFRSDVLWQDAELCNISYYPDWRAQDEMFPDGPALGVSREFAVGSGKRSHCIQFKGFDVQTNIFHRYLWPKFHSEHCLRLLGASQPGGYQEGAIMGNTAPRL